MSTRLAIAEEVIQLYPFLLTYLLIVKQRTWTESSYRLNCLDFAQQTLADAEKTRATLETQYDQMAQNIIEKSEEIIMLQTLLR